MKTLMGLILLAFLAFVEAAEASPPSGAACNVISVASPGVSIAVGSPNLTVGGASFASGDTGKIISVPNAGATVGGIKGTLNTTILAIVDATHVTLTANASTAVSIPETVIYGTDDSAALSAAFNAGGSLDLTGISGCIYSVPIVQSTPNRVTGIYRRSTLFYRQLSGTASTRAITLASGSAGSVYLNFVVNNDVGGQITSPTNAATIFAADNDLTFDGIEINANSAGQVQSSVGGISDRDSIADTLLLSDITVKNSVIHDIGAYAMFWGAVKDFYIQNNKFYNVGSFNFWSGVVRVSAFGTAATGKNIQLINNSCDTTNLTPTTDNECFIVVGNATNNWLGATVSGNFANQVLGDINFGIGLGYNLNYITNMTVSNNTCNGSWECIGTGNVIDAVVSNNVLVGVAIAGIESNTDLRMNFTGNYIDMPATGVYGLLIGNTFPAAVTGNTIYGGSTAGIIYNLATSYCCSSVGIALNGNVVRMPTGSSGKGIWISSRSPAQINDASATGNNIFSDGTAGSVGIELDVENGGSIAASTIGPNTINAPSVGVLVAQPNAAIDFCYVAGGNFAVTPTSIAGSNTCR